MYSLVELAKVLLVMVVLDELGVLLGRTVGPPKSDLRRLALFSINCLRFL